MATIYGNGGHDLRVDARLEWAVFESFAPCIRDVLRNAGLKVSALEAVPHIKQLRDSGKSDEEIAQWLAAAYQTATHAKYAAAGHPQPKYTGPLPENG